jgi:hypothetical protein
MMFKVKGEGNIESVRYDLTRFSWVAKIVIPQSELVSA